MVNGRHNSVVDGSVVGIFDGSNNNVVSHAESVVIHGYDVHLTRHDDTNT